MIEFPILYSERLKLRKLQVEDVPSLVKYGNNHKISKYILNLPYPYQEHDAVFRISYVHQGFKAKTRYVFAIAFKQTDEFIGEISLHMDHQNKIAQLAYWLGEPYWNQGFTTEAIKAILKFGFEKLNLELIFASCEAENEGSVSVLEKNNFLKTSSTGSVLQYAIKSKQYYLKP